MMINATPPTAPPTIGPTDESVPPPDGGVCDEDGMVVVAVKKWYTP